MSDERFRKDRRRAMVQISMFATVGTIGLLSWLFVRKRGNAIGVADLDSTSNVDIGASDVTQFGESSMPGASNSAANSTLLVEKYSCRDIHWQLGNYVLAKKLEPQQRTPVQRNLLAGFEAHLAKCPSCQKMVDKFEAQA